MNILYWLENFPKLSETFVTNEIRELRRRGHTVAVYSHFSPDPLPDDLADIDHYIAPDPTAISSLREVPKSLYRGLLISEFHRQALPTSNPARKLYILFHASKGKQFIESLPYEIDHIQGHFMFTPQVAASYLSNLLDVPHTVWGHANDLYEFDHEPTHQYLIEYCDELIAPCMYNAHVLRSLTSAVDSPSISVIPAGFDDSSYVPTDGYIEGRILTVARHVEKKGIRYGLDALESLPDEIQFHYHIASDGPLTDDLKRYAESLGISDQVTFLGRISDSKLKTELDEAHLFLLPAVVARSGDRDATPVSIKEAMAMETPVISTIVGGIPELVSDETGYLVKPRNVPELTTAIKQGLTSPPERGEEARQTVKSHAIKHTVDQLEALFSTLQTNYGKS